ncbi:MAG TPA: hypothetical protein PLR74_00570 [Agriterribacter sp.]|nr:hypothetical protein [Agriterribacter sp.]
MRSYFFILFLFTSAASFAQGGKKLPQKEKPPTQSEMEAVMKQARQMIDEMNPENKKMMDSMGINMPSFKNVPQVGDKALADAYAMEGVIVPPKNAKLIATIPTQTFSSAELLNYIKTTSASVATEIKPESKQTADKLIDLFKKDKYYGAMIASAANGLWTMGYKEAGVYLMGKATEALPNADNYNNYSAYLTMTGAAHMAIPVLNTLNSIHKKNSTILNNLGHAWLQLGDEPKATKYLDSTIMIYAYHPQANFTKCLVEESKGRTAEATVALKRSLKHSTTNEKLNKLKKLEKNPGPRKYHIPKVYTSSTFNLGIYTAMIPTVYAKIAGEAEENQWKQFREQIWKEIEKLEKKREALKKSLDEEAKQMGATMLKQKSQPVFPPYYFQASDRYRDYLEGLGRNMQKSMNEEMEAIQKMMDLKTAYGKELEAERKRYQKKENEAGVPLGPNCAGETPIHTKYLTTINGMNQKNNDLKVEEKVKTTYQHFYYATAIAVTDAQAMKAVLDLKIDFLSTLRELRHEFNPGVVCKEEKLPEYKNKELPDYDEVNCNILNWIYFPGFGSIVMRCNNMSMNINSKLLPFSGSLTANFDGYVEHASIGVKLKAGEIKTSAWFDKDGNFVEVKGSGSITIKGIEVSAGGVMNEDGFVKGSVEMGIGGELDFIPKTIEGEAPVEISLKETLGVGIEVSQEGIADFYVKEKVQGDIASNIEIDNTVETTPGMVSKTGEVTGHETATLPVKAPSVSISAGSRWSVNSGFSPAQGSLSGLKH